MELNFDEICKILPHKYPFIMIDKIIEIEKGKSAKGIKCVSNGEYYFNGHFPGRAIMPGVLQIEAVAQVGTLALLDEKEKRIAVLGGVKKARFYKIIRPGDVLEINCELIKLVRNLGICKGWITRENEKVMACEISFALV